MPASVKEQKIIDFLTDNDVSEKFTTKEFSQIVGMEIAPITMHRLVSFAILNHYQTKPKTYSVNLDEDYPLHSFRSEKKGE